MQNIYVLGSMRNWLTQASAGTRQIDKDATAGLTTYIAGMQAAGLGNDNAIENSQEGWDAGLEVNWAISRHAGRDQGHAEAAEPEHQHAGILWTRTPANYESYSDVDAAMAIINTDGSASLYKPAS